MTRIKEIASELSQIGEQVAIVDDELDALRATLTEIQEQISRRDWAQFGTRRPNNGIIDEQNPAWEESAEEATQRTRARLYAKAHDVESAIKDARNRASKLHERKRELENERHVLELTAITPEHLAEQIKQATDDLAKFRAGRQRLEKDLTQASDKRERVATAIADEERAEGALQSVRAASFLDSSDGKASAAVTKAKAELQTARDRAAAARAALPQIEEQIGEAQQALDAFEDGCAARRATIRRLQCERDVLIAQHTIAQHVDGLQTGLQALHAADPELGMRLADALYSKGLHVLDAQKRPERPAWMKGWHNPGEIRRTLESA